MGWYQSRSTYITYSRVEFEVIPVELIIRLTCRFHKTHLKKMWVLLQKKKKKEKIIWFGSLLKYKQWWGLAGHLVYAFQIATILFLRFVSWMHTWESSLNVHSLRLFPVYNKHMTPVRHGKFKSNKSMAREGCRRRYLKVPSENVESQRLNLVSDWLKT